MKILIVGLGYAGTRFLNAFLSLESSQFLEKIEIAYTSRRRTRTDIPYYENPSCALDDWQPDLVVVSVSDGAHAEILAQLNGYHGFILCEKPLVNAKDDLNALSRQLNNISGFCMDLVERYSEVSEFLKKYVQDNELSLIRANFIWGKDRIHDKRSTCGVSSEIIHALDLIQWITSSEKSLVLHAAIGTQSDFSVSGDKILDSVAITAMLGTALITGYSSFVNIERQRTIELVFGSPQQELIYARMVFDTPAWDIDHLRIWIRKSGGDQTITEFTTIFDDTPASWNTIHKLRRLAKDVVRFVADGTTPSLPFPNLSESIRLQEFLNSIENEILTIGPAKYMLGKTRPVFEDRNDLERLG